MTTPMTRPTDAERAQAVNFAIDLVADLVAANHIGKPMRDALLAGLQVGADALEAASEPLAPVEQWRERHDPNRKPSAERVGRALHAYNQIIGRGWPTDQTVPVPRGETLAERAMSAALRAAGVEG